MHLTRVIPRIDIKGPNVVKPIEYDGLRALGLAADFAKKYYEQGADEIVVIDVVASLYQRKFQLEVVRDIASHTFVPLTFGGGISSLDDIHQLLYAGVDKVAINTAAVKRPELLREAASHFGSQCVVSQIDFFLQENGSAEIWTDGGKEVSRYKLMDWVKIVEDMGVGEILLSCINRDGHGSGYELETLAKVVDAVSVPVIASCGAGSKEDLVKAVKIGRAHAVSAASVFHYGILEKVDGQTLHSKKANLRNGSTLDTGNIQFLNEGFGGFRVFPVTPFSIREAKSFMLENSIQVRKS